MKKDNLIFIHKLLKAIADSMIKVFIPLIILEKSGSIELAMGYLIIYSLFVMLYMFIFKKFIQKYGVIAILIHFIPSIATSYILSFASINIGIIILIASLMALTQALYSVPINLIFTFGDKKTNVGKFEIATNVGKLVTVLISGILISQIKESLLILSIVSSVIYLGCVIPLIFTYRDLIGNYDRVKDIQIVNKKLNPWFIAFHISFGIFQPIMDNVVPLYLYINNLSFEKVTYMMVIVEFIKIMINYLTQYLVKRSKAIICVIVGSILFIVSGICMLVVKNPLLLYVFSLTCSISFPLTFVPMFRLYCNDLKNSGNVFDGITRRDFEIFSGRPALYALSYVGFGLVPCIIVGILAVPVMLISELKLLKNNK